MDWEITTLYYGKINLPKGSMTPNFDDDLWIDIPYMGFLLQSREKNILVDTGINDKYIIDGKAWGGFEADAGGKYVLESLEKANVSPDDIESVLLTHLHNDHVGNVSWFKNAQIVFQKREWLTLLDPIPAMNVRRDYDPEAIPVLRRMNRIMINEDIEFEDGIKILKTPGHTAGSQTIAVNTKDGVRLIVGDHWHMNCMAFAGQDQLVDMDGNVHEITPAPKVYEGLIPSSLTYNYYDYYDSCNKLMALYSPLKPSNLLAGHEPSLLAP